MEWGFETGMARSFVCSPRLPATSSPIPTHRACRASSASPPRPCTGGPAVAEEVGNLRWGGARGRYNCRKRTNLYAARRVHETNEPDGAGRAALKCDPMRDGHCQAGSNRQWSGLGTRGESTIGNIYLDDQVATLADLPGLLRDGQGRTGVGTLEIIILRRSHCRKVGG